MVPRSFYNTFPCIFYFSNRNPKLVQAGKIHIFFDSKLSKINLDFLCYIGKNFTVVKKRSHAELPVPLKREIIDNGGLFRHRIILKKVTFNVTVLVMVFKSDEECNENKCNGTVWYGTVTLVGQIR